MISPEAQLPFITRVQPPKRRDHNVHRERLIKSVSENLNKKVQLVTAPAGYGKTALLVQLASELDLPTCWYSFAPEDNEPESLLRFCLQSIRTRFPEFGATYRPLTKKGLETDWLTKCGLLVSAIETDIDDDFILFFDDLHWIEGKPQSLECVSLLIERSPSNVHFVLSSRTRPTLPCLPKLAANDDLHALDVGDLRFSAKETGHLLSNLWGQSVTAKDAEKVTEQTGGWAAGIVLTAKTPTASGLAEAGNTGNQSILFEYLTTEVFDKLPNSLQQFLLRTSILREFTGAICDNILGLSNSDRLIDQIKNTGLFLEERAGEVATFAYHDLFREYLERRFQVEFHSDYLRISRRAAYWYRELGDDDAAIYHYLQIGEAGEVAEIVKQTSGSYFDQRGWGKLAGWLDRLPSSVLESDPELLLLSGRILAIRVGDPTGALERFDKVLASNSSHNPEIAGKALVAKSTAYRRLGDLARALKTARDGLAVLEKIECSPDQIAEAHRQVGSALATGGDLELGRQHFQTALQHTSPDNMSLLSLICDGLAVACIELGELDQAAVHLEHARTGWLKLGSEGPLAESLINLALVYYHQGEFDLAFDEAAEALRVAEASGYPRLVATALVRQASIQQALGQNEDALTASSRALEFARELLDQRLIAESTNHLDSLVTRPV